MSTVGDKLLIYALDYPEPPPPAVSISPYSTAWEVTIVGGGDSVDDGSIEKIFPFCVDSMILFACVRRART